MVVQDMSISKFAPVRKTILAVLIGLMGGGVAVLAQTPAATASGAPVAAPQQAAAVPPAAEAAPAAPAQQAAEPAQTAAPDASAAPAATPVAASAKPVVSAKGKKVKAKKEKAPKLTPVSIVQGTLTVDGWTGKARMNYDIADLKYIYMWAPEVGTVVVSNVKFPLGKEEQGAFSGNTLTVDANGHTLQLFSQKKLLKEKKPVSAWVYVDTGYKFPSTFPAMGYGNTIQAPYAWPGAKEVQVAKGGVVAPPPLPKELRPTLAKASCVPAGSKATGTPCAAAPAPAAATAAAAPAPAATATPTPAPAAPSN
jgi:hypothetical protein